MRAISTTAAPKPVAAYSQGIEANGFVFTAGQVGLDPQTSKLVEGLEGQTERALQNVAAVLEAAGLGFSNVVRVNIFVTDLSRFAAVNEIYQRFVGENRPARSTVGVASLPTGALIEIDATAARE